MIDRYFNFTQQRFESELGTDCQTVCCLLLNWLKVGRGVRNCSLVFGCVNAKLVHIRTEGTAFKQKRYGLINIV